jgi:hypothetical protein
VVTDNAGNAIVAGYTGEGITGTDFLIIKYSSAGGPLWTNRYDGPAHGNDEAASVAADSSGNVFVTGYSADSNGYFDYLTIKYSDAGVPLWTNRYNGPANNHDSATALAVDGNGDVCITGSSFAFVGFYDYATIKYSGAGMALWTNRYNGPSNGSDSPIAVTVDNSGNVFVTGYSASNGYLDYLTIKYSDAGVPLWTNRYDGPANSYDYATAVATDVGGNVFVTGYFYVTNNYDYVTIKYSGEGIPLWTNRYNGLRNDNDHANALAADGDGSVFVTGESVESDSYVRYTTIKYSGAGVPLWTNSSTHGLVGGLALDGNGNAFIMGGSYNAGTASDYATVALSGTGLLLWTNRYHEHGPNYARALAVGRDGAVYVTGSSSRSSTYDFVTVKYISPVLTIERSPSSVLVSWPSLFSDFVLEENVGSLSTANWSSVTDPIQNDGTNRTLIVNPPVGERSYRLFKP